MEVQAPSRLPQSAGMGDGGRAVTVPRGRNVELKNKSSERNVAWSVFWNTSERLNAREKG